MQYQEFIQDYPKVISFDLNQNIPESNTQISLIDDGINNTQDSESVVLIGLLVILTLACVMGLVLVLTNLIVKVIIKAYQDTQVSSEFYEQTKDLMRFDFEESSCLV